MPQRGRRWLTQILSRLVALNAFRKTPKQIAFDKEVLRTAFSWKCLHYGERTKVSTWCHPLVWLLFGNQSWGGCQTLTTNQSRSALDTPECLANSKGRWN